MNLKKYVKAVLLRNKIWKPRTVLEKSKLFGKDLITTRGTIRLNNDKDDAWFYELAKNMNNILDIGCNIGFMGILAKIANPGSKLILIDPNPNALEFAFKNLMLNKFTSNVNFINAFVGERGGGDIKFYAITTDASGSMFKGSAQSAAMVNSFYYVQTTTVDEICKQNNFTPDFIKVDVEGAESFVLKGSKETARNHKPVYLVEMHAPEEMPMLKNAELVLTWCKEVNYTAYYMTNHSVLTDSKEIAYRGKCHLFLTPLYSKILLCHILSWISYLIISPFPYLPLRKLFFQFCFLYYQ